MNANHIASNVKSNRQLTALLCLHWSAQVVTQQNAQLTLLVHQPCLVTNGSRDGGPTNRVVGRNVIGVGAATAASPVIADTTASTRIERALREPAGVMRRLPPARMNKFDLLNGVMYLVVDIDQARMLVILRFSMRANGVLWTPNTNAEWCLKHVSYG